MMRHPLLWLHLPALLLIAPCAGAQLAYENQNSATTGWHSGIVTSKGVVWDNDFAKMASNALGNNYNEAAFAFMECFGGGMIDELKSAGLTNTAYTSASTYYELSYYTNADKASGGKSESAYNLQFAPVAGGAGKASFKDAATAGVNKDFFGPVVRNKPIEHPQYTADKVGDGIILHQNNPLNTTPNKNYLALVFGGYDFKDKDDANLNSRSRMTDALRARGYTPDELRVTSLLSSAAELKQGFEWVKDNITANTQFYYWNNILHGSFDFEVNFADAARGNKIQSGSLYSFQLPTDHGADFLTQLQQLHDYYTTNNTTEPDLMPYFEIQATQQVSDLSILLNNRPLSLLDMSDLYDDQSVFVYRFMLTNQDLAFLEQNYAGQSDNLYSISWSGNSDPGFTHIDINTGQGSNGIAVDTPEPGSLALLSAACFGAGLVQRRRRQKRLRNSRG